MPFDGEASVDAVTLGAAMLLDAAAEWLREPDRWGQHALRLNGRVCLVGALYCAALGPEWSGYGKRLPPEYMRARRFLRDRIDGGLEAWNDAPGRRHSEVLALLRETAAAARQGRIV